MRIRKLCLILPAMLLLWSVAPVRAADARDRAGIETAVSALNDARRLKDGAGLSALLASDISPAERNLLIRFESELTAVARQPMSEVMMPHAALRELIFVTPDVAVAEVVNSSVHQTATVEVLILKKEGAGWRIAMVRGPAPVRGPE